MPTFLNAFWFALACSGLTPVRRSFAQFKTALGSRPKQLMEFPGAPRARCRVVRTEFAISRAKNSWEAVLIDDSHRKKTVRETLPWGDFLVAFVVKAVEPDQGGPIRPTRVISSRIDNE